MNAMNCFHSDSRRVTTRVRVMVAVCAVALAGALPPSSAVAQGSDWPGIVSAGKKEGKVLFYTGQPTPVAIRLAAGFKKAYPDIALEYVRGPSGEVLAKIEQERATGIDGGDVFLTTEITWFSDRAAEGKLLRLTGPALAQWPAQYLRGPSVAIVGSDPFIITYNKKLVSNPPKGYADLLRPEFKGRLGTTELASTVLIAWYDWLEKTQGVDFLNKLKAQNPRLYNGATPLAQSVASGEIAVSAFGVPTATTPLIEQGAPIGYVVPSPGLGNLYGVAAVGWSKRPNAALVLTDYIMSMDGQTAWHGRGESASPLPGVPGAIPAATITPYDPGKYPPPVAAKYREYWTKIFK